LDDFFPQKNLLVVYKKGFGLKLGDFSQTYLVTLEKFIPGFQHWQAFVQDRSDCVGVSCQKL
jgi:hypothetical protein